MLRTFAQAGLTHYGEPEAGHRRNANRLLARLGCCSETSDVACFSLDLHRQICKVEDPWVVGLRHKHICIFLFSLNKRQCKLVRFQSKQTKPAASRDHCNHTSIGTDRINSSALAKYCRNEKKANLILRSLTFANHRAIRGTVKGLSVKLGVAGDYLASQTAAGFGCICSRQACRNWRRETERANTGGTSMLGRREAEFYEARRASSKHRQKESDSGNCCAASHPFATPADLNKEVPGRAKRTRLKPERNNDWEESTLRCIHTITCPCSGYEQRPNKAVRVGNRSTPFKRRLWR